MRTRGQRASSFILHPSSLLAPARGFTLVELLVVIAIIAILAALLLPALNAAMRRAEETQARTEAKSIETAVKAYLNEYGKFPHGSGGTDYSYGTPARNNRELMNVLRSLNGPGNVSFANNARKIVFLEVSEQSLTADGDFRDPWDQQYGVVADTSFNNVSEVSVAPLSTNVQNKSVVVWSAGRDGTLANADDIKSWQ